MKRIFYKGGILLSMALTMVSCSDDNPWAGSKDEGGIFLSLTADGTMLSSNMGSRADVDEYGVVSVETTDLSIRLSKTDGSISRTFANIDEFKKEESFPIGDYKIEAFYGNEKGLGFGNAYYYGQENLTVKPGEVSSVSLTATLANAMVKVNFSDELQAMYTGLTASVTSDNTSFVNFTPSEKRGAYIPAGDININLTMKNGAGKEVTLQPAKFVAAPRHSYNLNFGVAPDPDGTGTLVLSVTFDDEVESEVVEIDLTDELFDAAAPVVTCSGIEADGFITALEGAVLNPVPAFDVVCAGGIKSATLTIESDTFTPIFGNVIDLCSATAAQQSQLEGLGINAIGFFRNPDRLAKVSFGGVTSKLPQGSHKFTLSVTDANGRTSEPVSFTIGISVVMIESEVETQPDYEGDKLSLILSASTEDVKDKVSFMISDESGVLQPATILSVEEVPTRANLAYKFKYTLSMPVNSTTNVDVAVIFNGKVVKNLHVAKNVPGYSVEVDAFSSKAVLKVTASDASQLSSVVRSLIVIKDGRQVAESNLTRDLNTGIIEILNLTPATSYSGYSVTIGNIGNSDKKSVPDFTTEAETNVPNGDFSANSIKINIKINTGGQYKYLVTTYQNTTTINCAEPDGWSSINAKTCYTGSNPMNTWFCVPSTFTSFVGDKADGVVVRSVAYDHNGTMPTLDDHKTSVKNKYCRNTPTSIASKASGELFLGSYSFTGSENRVDGIAFGSRPASLSFDYSYAPVNGENGYAYISVIGEDGSLLAFAQADLTASADMKRMTLSLAGYPFKKKAAKIYVQFKSTKGSSVSAPFPSDLDDVGTTVPKSGGYIIDTNAYKALCVGSVLKINNVSLGY